MSAAHAKNLRAAEAHLSEVDPALARVIAKVGPCTMKVERGFDPYRALTRSIVYQQLTGKAAETIYGRLEHAFGGSLEAEKVAKARMPKLRACGLSTSKAKALLDLSQRQRDGLIPSAKKLHSMPNEDIIEVLTEVFGIGPWSVQMMLMFRMGRLDVMPVEDYGVRKGYSVMVGAKDLVSKAELNAGAAAWAPYRSVGSWYMWRVLELPK